MDQVRPGLIGVVGVCASGKTTLVNGLKALGYQARNIPQEHSVVPGLWRRYQPEFLVMLDATLPTIRARRPVAWGEERLAEQLQRLASARSHCHLYLPTDGLSIDEVREAVCEAFHRFREQEVDYEGHPERGQA